MPGIEEGARLSWGDKNKIERAVDQAHNGVMPVAITIEAHGKQFRVLVGKVIDKAKLLAERENII